MSTKRDWRSKVARLKARQEPGHAEELAHRADPAKAAKNATIRYLERVRDLISRESKVERAAVSNYRIAQRLDIAPNRLSQYYGHGGSMDNKLAYQVAKVLGEEPMVVIAEIEADRAVRDEDRSFWRSVARKVAGVVLPAAIASVIAPLPSAEASVLQRVQSPVYYVKSRRWSWLLGLPGFAGDDDQAPA